MSGNCAIHADEQEGLGVGFGSLMARAKLPLAIGTARHLNDRQRKYVRIQGLFRQEQGCYIACFKFVDARQIAWIGKIT
jgi:hypothetical protein